MSTALDLDELEVFRIAERLSDTVWRIVGRWANFPRGTLGKQLVRAADSVGANIAEGFGRGSYQDNRRFVRIARGSLYEVRYWLRRAHARRLVTAEQVATLQPLLGELAPRLNAYLNAIGPVRRDTPPQQTDPRRHKTRDK